jgi:hypothetical protein
MVGAGASRNGACSMSEILQPNTPRNFEGRNIRTPKRSGATNDLYLVQFEITREAWEDLETIPKNAVLGGVIWYNDGEDDPIELSIKPPRKKDAPKGEHGAYWNILCKDGLFNNRDLQTAIEAELGVAELTDYEQGLRDVFQVTSRTFIKPIDFEQFLGRYNLAGLITKSRQAVEKAKTHLASKGEA